MWDILGVGTAAVDDLLYVDHFPQPDTKSPVRERRRQGGGQTATALVAAARQGARTAFCCRLGEDELSSFTLQELEREGVDCSPVVRVVGARPFHSIVIVDASTGSRTILYNSEGVQELEVDSINPDWIASSKMLFIDHNTPHSGLQAARLANQLGVPVIADLEKVHMANRAELLDCTDHLIVGVDFASQVTGQAGIEDMLHALSGPQRRDISPRRDAEHRAACVITRGSQGCWYSERGGPVIHVPAIPVQAVDTTGCGDVFHGAYAAAITRGETVARAVQIATVTAGLKATQPGGRAGIPTLEVVEEYLKK